MIIFVTERSEMFQQEEVGIVDIVILVINFTIFILTLVHLIMC